MNFGKNGIITSSDYCEIPNIYTRIEYIQGTGTQYINSNLSLPNGFKANVDIVITNVSSSNGIVGCHTGNSSDYKRNYIGMSSNGPKFIIAYGSNGTSYTYAAQKTTVDTFYHIESSNIYQNRYFIINGTTTSLNSDSSQIYSDLPLAIMGFNQGGTVATFAKAKLYYLSLKDYQDNLVGNYFPVKRLSDSKPGLYDTVTGTFFTNAGTGEFTLGPELGNNVGIYSDKIISNDFIEF